MNNVTVMRMLQSVGGLLQKMIHMLWCQGFRSVVAQPARKRTIFAKGHDHIGEQEPIHTFLAVVEQGQNVGMVEHRDGFHLPLEKTSRFFGSIDTRILDPFVTKKLDSYLALYVRIFRKVYFTHAATTDYEDQVIPAKLQSCELHIDTLRKLSDAYTYQINVYSITGSITLYQSQRR